MKRLDITKLENVVEKQGKIVARCPACAKCGGDRKGEHLVIFPGGKFGCVTHPNDRQHRKEILDLAGAETGLSRGPIPVEIKRPACADREPRRLCVVSIAPNRRRTAEDFEPDDELAEWLRDSILDPSMQPVRDEDDYLNEV